jgi:ketosteroid isomerase-like protein
MNRSLASTIRAANSTLLAGGDLDAVGEFFAPDFVAHLTDRDLTGGPGAVRGFLATLRRAFPDLQVEVEVLVEGEDRVAWQRKISETLLGEYNVFPYTLL